MSLTNWLFGSLKRKSPEDKTVATEVFEVGSDEGYTIIQAPTPGLYPQIPVPQTTTLPYSVLPHSTQQSENQTSPVNFGRTTSVNNQIDGVPFRIAPHLETHRSSNGFELDSLKQVLQQCQSEFKNNSYDYNFKLEKNIIHESLSFNRVRRD